MVTMNTRSELLVAVPHAAHRAAGGRSHPQQLQLEHVGSQHSQAADVTPTAQAALQQQAAAAAGPPCNTTAPATAPGQQDPLSGVKAQFLQQVLSLTNYSQLGSAPLLDPLVASKNYQQMQEVVQQQQTLFCRWVPSTHVGRQGDNNTLPVMTQQAMTKFFKRQNDRCNQALDGQAHYSCAVLCNLQM
jgi:hypothetical protein